MADVGDFTTWSTTAASNGPSGATIIGAGLDDNLRQIQAEVAKWRDGTGYGILTVTSVAGTANSITGNTSPAPVLAANQKFMIVPASTNTGSVSLALNGGSFVTVMAGAAICSGGEFDPRVPVLLEYDGTKHNIIGSTRISFLTNALSGDVLLNNTSNYFDGPTVAQGTSGTWLVMGAVTLTDTAGAANIDVKLWDGTTVIDSGRYSSASTNARGVVTLNGIITSPAGNLRISAKDTTSTSGVMNSNVTGSSKDSTITAIRIA